jgi:flagellar protein FliS
MLTTAYAQYRTVSTTTGGPGELLLLLYQAAIKNVGQGRTAIDCGRPALAHSHLMRAQEIITALQNTLDFQQGGEIATTLASLYTFMQRRLMTANVNKEVAPLDEVLPILRQLLSAWQVAVREAGRRAG